MKYFYSLFILVLMCIAAIAQPLPIMRNAMSTNVAGTPVLSQNDLSVTNVGSGTNWLFYGIVTQTVARLGDVWGSTGSVSLITVSNVVSGYGSNLFILKFNGIGTNTTFDPSNLFTFAAYVNGPLIVSNELKTNFSGLIVVGTNAGFYADGGNGDINGSGHLSAADQALMIQWIAGGAASDTFLTNPAARARADIDGNGRIDFNDIGIASRVVLGATNIVDFRHQVQRSIAGTYSADTNRFFLIGCTELIGDGRFNFMAKLEVLNTNRAYSDFMVNTNEFVVSNHLTTANGSVDIYTNLLVRGSNHVTGQAYFGNTVYVDGAGSGLEVDGLTVTNGITNFGTFFIRDNAVSNALWRCTNTTTGQGTWANNYLNSTEVSNLVSSVAYGQTWFVWGSSNTLATNAAGTPYKAMLKGDTPLPATANTNTYTTPTAGQYVGEVITAIPAGISLIVPGDIVTESFAYLSENRTMVLQPEIYIRTNMIAPSFSALGEREVAVGPSFTVNNTFQSFAVNIPVTTNIVLSTTNYLVRKLRVVSVSGGTPNLLLVSQDGYPARVTFPIASSSFVLKSGDTMLGTLVLTNSYNVGTAFRSIGAGSESEQFGLGATATGLRGIALGRTAGAASDNSIAIGYSTLANTAFGTGSVAIAESASADFDNSVAIGFHAQASSILGVAIGSSSTADGGDTEIAIGGGSHAAFHNSTAIGYGVHSTKSDQMIFGQATNMITIPGFLELPIGAAVGKFWECTNATTGRGQWTAIADTLVYNTNAALNGDTVDMNLPYQTTNAAGAITFTGLSNTDASKTKTVSMFIDASGADRLITIPASWKNHQVSTTFTVTNGWVGVLTICQYGNVMTNVAWTLIK